MQTPKVLTVRKWPKRLKNFMNRVVGKDKESRLRLITVGIITKLQGKAKRR